MSSEPTTVDKLRALPWSIATNAALSIFVQLTFFGSVFVLFLSELGLSKSEIGLLLSLLPFTALIAPLVAPAVARFGFRRTYLTFFGLRTLVTGGLLLTPWVVYGFGAQAATIYVGSVVATFALLRAVGVTAGFPWTQEYVPNSVRGKFTATNNIFSTATAFLAVTVAGFVLARTQGLSGYMILMAAGVLGGLLSVWFASHIPGGAPASAAGREGPRRDVREALRDRNFLRYLLGVGFLTLATVPLVSFLPLFMQEQVGLNSSQVVWLQTGTMVGALLSSYLWGWAADRYGSRPVALYGVALRMVLPILWVMMPRFSPWSLSAALSIAVLQGVANVSWAVGSARLLHVSVVPPDRKTDYMALYFAWIGIVGGFSQLIGGWILDFTQNLSGQLWAITLDPYLPIFLMGLILPVIVIVLLKNIRDDHTVGMGRFAGIFLRGNPILALEAVIRYYRARDEHTAVLITEKLGQAKSLLTVEELLEALADPRFHVRFEALISIARMAPDERLIEALTEVLNGQEPALSTVAAWALGRMGDERALPALRQALTASQYRSVKVHSSRSLGALGDTGITDFLLGQLNCETDYGLQIAFASTLGQLQERRAIGHLLGLLWISRDPASRQELALALARIVGDEHHFVQLLRDARKEAGTATAQAVLAIKDRLDSSGQDACRLIAALETCAEYLAREELDAGMAALSRTIRLLPRDRFDDLHRLILRHCARRLEQFGSQRLEYAILALNTIDVSLRH